MPQCQPEPDEDEQPDELRPLHVTGRGQRWAGNEQDQAARIHRNNRPSRMGVGGKFEF